jgi:hypothetical protein
MRPIIVLYEDAPGNQPREFGPHNLALACLADRLNRSVYDLKQHVEGHPKKGNDRVRQESHRLAADKIVVFAVYDDDRICELTALPSTACKREVVAALQPQTTPAHVTVVLLHQRIETLLKAARSCSKQPALTRKPSPLDRDIHLNRLALDPTRRQERDCVLRDMPSFAYLVDKLAGALA